MLHFRRVSIVQSLLVSVLFSYQGNLASSTLDTILSIQPKDSSSGGGETRESIVRRQAGEMLEKLPADYIPHEVYIPLSLLSSPATGDCLPPFLSPLQVKARLAKMGAIAPINIFLRQEIDRMQRVISNVRSTLQDLQLAIDGTIVMSEVGVALHHMPAHYFKFVSICARKRKHLNQFQIGWFGQITVMWFTESGFEVH